MILAWIIVGSFYVLASLGAKGHLPDRLGIFLTTIIAISLALHVCVRFLAPNSSQVLLPIATLLNGVGYVEIARWNPTAAGFQALWFLVSAAAVVVTLTLVRRVRDLDRYRYLTLLAAVGLLVLPLVPHFGESIYGARLWVHVGPISFQPVEIAKILLGLFLRVVLRRQSGVAFHADTTNRSTPDRSAQGVAADTLRVGILHGDSRRRERHRFRAAAFRAVHLHALGHDRTEDLRRARHGTFRWPACTSQRATSVKCTCASPTG